MLCSLQLSAAEAQQEMPQQRDYKISKSQVDPTNLFSFPQAIEKVLVPESAAQSAARRRPIRGSIGSCRHPLAQRALACSISDTVLPFFYEAHFYVSMIDRATLGPDFVHVGNGLSLLVEIVLATFTKVEFKLLMYIIHLADH
ncbi:hypothetical protein PILCRDRAFT_687049 [Piloderma croceum F 1598]|uniref:Uncharacterized protein n=1 Tax=Piloderma croceum (strain F 1598) TaxID=765440 RepID=A0A0C3AMD1_PILCF|nr:hypothetical protein PILCRDRAFT_687049 [Piloderma croceum F 1598]